METKEIISSGILELYSMGLASEKESSDVEAWVKRYPEVALELLQIQTGLENYALAHAIEPAQEVKKKVLSRIQIETEFQIIDQNPANISTANVYHISSIWKYAAAASVILLIGSVILNYSLFNKYKNTSDELATAHNELNDQKQLAQSMKKDMGVMTNMNAQPISLQAVPEVDNAAARIYWVKKTGEVYIDPSNLPAVPEGMQYQFWGIVDGKPVSGGMITRTQDGNIVHVQKMKSFGRAEAFAVSLEKEGLESSSPTKVYVMGTL